jgi:phage tail sheath protein FI
MPLALTYPGVYIEEVPSGVHAIAGVATSITAFVGTALRGPTNTPTTVGSLMEFSRTFGDLTAGASAIGFAVRDFFQNGGSQAIIVRIASGATAAKIATGTAANALALQAANEGAWGNNLRVRIEHVASDAVTDAVAQGLTPAGTAPPYTHADLFNLIVQDRATGAVEQYRNLTVKPSSQRVDQILRAQSALVRVSGALPAAVPDATPGPAPGKTIYQDDAAWANADGSGTDGSDPDAAHYAPTDGSAAGINALLTVDLFNILCLPLRYASGDPIAAVLSSAAALCEQRRAILLIDPPTDWTAPAQALSGVSGFAVKSKNAALYYPALMEPNPLQNGQLAPVSPSGAVAGVIARTDAQRGVWKAPAGVEATLNGVPQLGITLTDAQTGDLNSRGVNCLRAIPGAGRVVWGARTLQGDDRLASEYKYLPVRRLALYIEESLFRGTQWVVFEPNDEPLWAQIRLNVGAFMQNLFRQGAFQGNTPAQAYFVKCDAETTTQNDIDLGVVNVAVGFAPLKPAEFVVIQIQQIAGQVQV